MTTTVPDTVWLIPNGNAEYTAADQNDIVDPLANNLVDPSGNQIVDTALTQTLVPDTEWVSDDAS